MKWTVRIVPASGHDPEYRIDVEEEALPSIGDHIVVQLNDEQQEVALKVRQVVHNLRRRDQESAVDEVTVEAGRVDQLSTNLP